MVPYRERAREPGGEVGFGATGGEAALPAELNQFLPPHRREIHPRAAHTRASYNHRRSTSTNGFWWRWWPVGSEVGELLVMD